MSAPDNRLISALSDRYRLERELGAGGMATVYLADDLRHQRKVAVKVLKPELAAAVGAERFVREITTTANLRHPHILPLFDSGERDGILFYVMPLIEGETLRDRLRRESRLSIDAALRIADDIADALHYAHARGVVHRDIKPENILLENGHAVVADFGIAQLARDTRDEKLTQTGMSLGTPHYMSPEQATAEAVDERTDQYALACMLFEMLVGQPPYSGANATAIIMRHVMDAVPDVTAARAEVPANVGAAISRAMAKNAHDRFATIGDWRAALQATGQRTAAHTAAGIAQPPLRKLPPSPPTALLGRDAQVESAIAELQNGARILTITGVGGTGKTRFAIELFTRLHQAYEGGAAFVSLASVTAASEVLSTIATTLDIAEAHGRSALDAIVTVIGARRVLLVVDNMEQVIDAAGDIAALSAQCAGLHIVTTSRRPLKVGAEVELALPPLELPSQGDTTVNELMHCPSVALFVQRAAKVKAGFALTDANAAVVTKICRSLDGLPLALELAAARVRILEPAALLQRLDHALDLLTSGDRDLPLRQRTLRATISWSYSLLSPDEQRTLRRLSAFHEGWTFEAMERVCYDEADRGRALDELESLVEKGLVRVIGSGERYTLLETIRAFSAEQLHAGGEVAAVRDAHAAYFSEFARGVHEGIEGTEQLAAMARGRAENANTLAALGWLADKARHGDHQALQQALAMCGGLCWYWHIVGLHMVAGEMVSALLTLARDHAPSRERAMACFTSAMVNVSTGRFGEAIADWTRQADDAHALGDDALASFGHGGVGYASLGAGDVEQSAKSLERAIECAQRAGNAFHVSLWHAVKGMLLFVTGNAAEGRALVESARASLIRMGDYEVRGMAESFLASMTFAGGDFAGALAMYREAERSFTIVGDKPELARVRGEMGYAALAGGDITEARTLFQRALRTNDEIGSAPGTGQALIGLAAAEAAAGNTQRAVAIAAAASVLRDKAGVVIEHPMAAGVTERIEAIKAAVPSAELEALVASGAALKPAEVLAMVEG